MKALVNIIVFVCSSCSFGDVNGQQLAGTKEYPYLLSNGKAMEELYQIKDAVKSVQITVTDFQSVAAVTAPDKKNVYKVQVTVDRKRKVISEVSDKHHPGFRLRNEYTYDDFNKIKTRKVYDDNFDGKGWQLNEEFLYSYKKDKDGNYYDKLVTSTDPRPGSDAPATWKGRAFYNNKNQLIKSIEGSLTLEYSYNEQGDIVRETVDGGTDEARGQAEYKYVYDLKGNWIKKETYRTSRHKDHLLEQTIIRKIVY